MNCQSCVKKLTDALQVVPGVIRAVVTLIPPQAKVEISTHVDTDALNSAVMLVGTYSLTEKVSEIGKPTSTAEPSTSEQSLTPLFVVISYIIGGVLLRAFISDDFFFHTLMGNFMGAFFIVFSLFKMINLSGFADGYGTYDILAKHSRGYALAYPFIELGLGIAYFIHIAPMVTNIATLVLMLIGAVGVAQAIQQKRAIQCACLGTALKLPMTKVTLAEDLVMAAMAFLMLVV